jgi:F-box/leucine-rich repeat protein 4
VYIRKRDQHSSCLANCIRLIALLWLCERLPIYLRLAQYASEVLDFSSQYGSDNSISYTAHNIVGVPTKFPAYGDFSQTFVMRDYGPWWQAVLIAYPNFLYARSAEKSAAENKNSALFEKVLFNTSVVGPDTNYLYRI